MVILYMYMYIYTYIHVSTNLCCICQWIHTNHNSHSSDPDEMFAKVLLQRKSRSASEETDLPTPVKGKVYFEQLQVCVV